MLNEQNVFALTNTGYNLLKLEGNCGRKIRRFLSRVIGEHNMLLQQFHEGLGVKEFEALTSYAESLLLQTNALLANNSTVKPGVTCYDKDFDVIQNVFVAKVDIKTAPVSQLKELLRVVIILSEVLQRFVANPAQVVSEFSMETAFIERNFRAA